MYKTTSWNLAAPIVAGLGLFAGCASDVGPGSALDGQEMPVALYDVPVGPFEVGGNLLNCDSPQTEGEGLAELATHDLDKMNAELRSDALLRDATGLDEVSNCEQARTFDLAARELGEPSAEELPVAELYPDAFDEEIDPLAARTGDPSIDKVFNGTAQRKRGSVAFLTFGPGFRNQAVCSGSLISDNELITSAHCFNAELGISSGLTHIQVLYMAPGGQDLWITQSNSALFTVAEVTMAPGFTSVTDTSDDMAIVRLVSWPAGDGTNTAGSWQNLPGTDSNHYVTLSRHSPSTKTGFKVNGSGRFSETNTSLGTARTTTDSSFMVPSWVPRSLTYFLNKAPASGRMCAGDSGSQAIYNHRSNSNVLLGVHSNADGRDADGDGIAELACNRVGFKQRWTAVAKKADWIRDVHNANNPFDRCTTVDDAGVSVYRCW